jgi:hypothetical protein
VGGVKAAGEASTGARGSARGNGGAVTAATGCVAAAVLTAYSAVGNAMPPPFGAALAREIVRSATAAKSGL